MVGDQKPNERLQPEHEQHQDHSHCDCQAEKGQRDKIPEQRTFPFRVVRFELVRDFAYFVLALGDRS